MYVVSEIRTRRYRGKKPAAISKPEHVHRLVFPRLKDEKREHFVALYLTARNTVIAQETISVGSLSASLVHPREVFRPAILHAAAALILAHNHPSGDPTPSEEDVALTKRLREAGQLLGIEVLDHVVLASEGFASMREQHSLR